MIKRESIIKEQLGINPKIYLYFTVIGVLAQAIYSVERKESNMLNPEYVSFDYPLVYLYNQLNVYAVSPHLIG